MNTSVLRWGSKRLLWLESSHIEQCMAYCKENHLDGIAISKLQGFYLDNMEFLRGFPWVQGIVVPAGKAIDISGLKYLRDLRLISITDNHQPINFADFPCLQEVRVEWHSKMTITSECKKLEYLHLRKFQSRACDLSELPALENLRELGLVQGPLKDLNGIQKYRKLEKVELSHMTKLESVADLDLQSLVELDCGVCKRITDHASVSKLKSLKILRFNDCGSIPSIKFIEEMPNLEDFRFVNTNVVDGDLRPLLKLKSAGFFKKKHFSHTPEEIDELLKRK